MPDFNQYMMRHGEHGMLTIVEIIERNEGIRSRNDVTLEDRWNALMQESSPQPPSLAA